MYANGWLKKWLKFAELTTVTQGALGTDFTNLTQSAIIQVGKSNSISQGSLLNASVDRSNAPGLEIFVYYQPELMLQIYNSTIQGTIYLNDRGPIADGLNLFVAKHQIGLSFPYQRYSIRHEAVFQGREATRQKYSHSYGGIHLAYRFL